MILLILGGSRSGKSDLAERAAAALPPPVTYLATGEITDDDLARRVELHRRRRPASWSTVETGLDLPGALASTSGTVLVDALGSWLARDPSFEVDVDALLAALRGRSGDTVIVSDEVGLGVHPPTAVGRRFRDALGSLNQAVSAVADRVLLVVAGRVVELSTPVDVLGW